MAHSSPKIQPIAARGMASLSRSSPIALRMTTMIVQERNQNSRPLMRRQVMHRCSCPTTVASFFQSSVRCFQSVALYHEVADSTLESIQDALDALFESMPPQHNNSSDSGGGDFEVSYASGVLTIVMPPHGTWVLNKQTPNQQIWWSSPLSGPRRYEYENDQWVYTRSEGGGDLSSVISLGQTLRDEIRQLYQLELDLEDVN